MEIWEVSMTGSNMMFETALSTQFITSICARWPQVFGGHCRWSCGDAKPGGFGG